MSLGLGKSSVERLPEGEVRTSIRLPRGTYVRLILHWDIHLATLYTPHCLTCMCSKWFTALMVPAQPSDVILTLARSPIPSGI